MSGDIDEARRLRNLVNRTAPKLRQRFYQSKIATLEETSSKDWWKHMKNLMGAPSGNTNEMQGLANKCTEGDMTQLVNSMNDFFVSVSADLPRLDPTHRVFDIEEPLPAEFTIEAASTQRALQNVKCRKATGPDNIPPWMVKNYAHLLAAPVTAIFNSSLREGKLPDLWKTATIVPVPKKHPPGSLENDIRPISLTPILAKVFEGIVLNWVDDVITPQIDERQFGGLWCVRYLMGNSYFRPAQSSKPFDTSAHWFEPVGNWENILYAEFASSCDLHLHGGRYSAIMYQKRFFNLLTRGQCMFMHCYFVSGPT